MKISFFFLIVFIFFSCKSASDKKAMLNRLVDKTCRATSLRRQRYLLANQIDSVQDTLMTLKNNLDSMRLQQDIVMLMNEKNVLVRKSLLLADSISLDFDSLKLYNDQKIIQKFGLLLDSVLATCKCEPRQALISKNDRQTK